VTGASAEQAKFFLESSGGAVDTAVSAFYDHQEGGGEAGGDQGMQQPQAQAQRLWGALPVLRGRATWRDDTAFGAMSAEGEDDMGDEVQQRQPQRGGSWGPGRSPGETLPAAAVVPPVEAGVGVGVLGVPGFRDVRRPAEPWRGGGG